MSVGCEALVCCGGPLDGLEVDPREVQSNRYRTGIRALGASVADFEFRVWGTDRSRHPTVTYVRGNGRRLLYESTEK